jgi:hypothetical protein
MLEFIEVLQLLNIEFETGRIDVSTLFVDTKDKAGKRIARYLFKDTISNEPEYIDTKEFGK